MLGGRSSHASTMRGENEMAYAIVHHFPGGTEE